MFPNQTTGGNGEAQGRPQAAAARQPLATPAGAAGQPPSKAEQLFEALDQQIIGAVPDCWVSTVYGIYVDHDQAWVQVGSAYDPTWSVVVHLSGACTPHHARAALTAWSQQDPADRSSLIDVMRLV